MGRAGTSCCVHGTPEEWGGALERLWSDPEFRLRMGQRARHVAEERDSFYTATPGLLDVLARAAATRDLRAPGRSHEGALPLRAASIFRISGRDRIV